ncbi:hypothetical protein PFISCL1PPCAC_1436, partial [Pristionchus fissidentatus]
EQRTENNEREVDKEYLGLLERRLHSVKNPTGKKATAKQFISDIASVKDHQLFNLLTADSTETNKFDDDFIDQPSLIQRKLVPQSCAVATSEKLKLVKNDHVQKIVDLLEEEGKERKEEEKEEEKEEKVGHSDFLPHSSSDSTTRSTRSLLSSMTISGSKRSLTQSLSGGSSTFTPRLTQMEIVAIDAIEESPRERVPGKILVASCWGETCELGTTSRYQLVLFRIEMHTGKTSVLTTEDISRPIALCRFINYRSMKKGTIGLLTFPSNERPLIYQLTPAEDGLFSLVPTHDCEKEFPELTKEAMPGTVVKMATETFGRYRWTAIGCDNGHFRFWQTEVANSKVVVVKRMRFFGAVAVVDIYQPYKDEMYLLQDEQSTTVHVILSSTLGPVAIHRVVQYRNDTSGVRWEQRALLAGSADRDTVTSSARKGDYLCVGFYSQHMFTYNLKQVIGLQSHNAILPPLSVASVNAPIAAIRFLSQFEMSLLTFAGHHSLMTMDEVVEEEEDEEYRMAKKRHQSSQKSTWVPTVGNGGIQK